MAMTPDDEQRLRALQSEAQGHLDRYHDAIKRRDLFIRELYGQRRADPVDLMRVTGIASRGMMHGIVKGARKPTWRREANPIARFGPLQQRIMDHMAADPGAVLPPVAVQEALGLSQSPARAMAALAERGYLERLGNGGPLYRFVRGES